MFKNDRIYICIVDVYKCGEFDETNQFAFKSRKSARNYNRKHWGGCGSIYPVQPGEAVVYSDRIVFNDEFHFTVWFQHTEKW